MDRKLLWIWALSKPGITSHTLTKILDTVGEIEDVYNADEKVLKKHGVSKKNIELLKDKSLERAKQIVYECKNLGIDIMTYDDEDYPDSLAMLYDPPYVLYVGGNRFNLNDRLLISLVGSRYSDKYGLAAAKQFAYDLAKCGVVVVSGMAEGGDTASLTGALDAGGTVVSILANGIDICYPAENYELMKRLLTEGMVISEYPPGTEPKRQHFPVRNRLISGISEGTVVTSAKAKSGTLITAKSALDQSKDVFAIPGNITNPTSEGTNNLIKDAYAKPITTVADILVEYTDYFSSVYNDIKNKKDVEQFAKAKESLSYASVKEHETQDITPASSVKTITLSDDERKIVTSLSLRPTHFDVLAKKSGIDQNELSMMLTILEMKEIIKSLPGNHFCLNI